MKTPLILTILSVLAASTLSAEEDCSIYSPCPGGATEYIPYQGPQQIILGAGKLVDTSRTWFALPVYLDYPVRSYRIIGTIIEHGYSKETGPNEFRAMQSMARAAKIHGADAMVLLRLTNEERRKIKDDRPWIFAHALAITWRMDGPPRKRPPR